MSYRADRWTSVGAAIEGRRKTLRITKAELIRLAGVSDKTLAGYIAGQPIVREDKTRGIEVALQWPAGTVALLARGELLPGDAVSMRTGERTAGQAETVNADALDSYERGISELRSRVEALEAWRAQVELEAGELGLAARSSGPVDVQQAKASPRRSRPSPN
jgi:hypothetical protein